jgi:ribosome biogenesis protein YTM1
MSESASTSKDQVKVKFFTRDDDETLHVSSNPIYIPVSLKRFGLSEIVNHLLETETPVPFEFLIDGTILKTDIQDYLVNNGLSTEAFLTLEYTRAVLPPKFLSSFNNDDWISSIDSIGSMELPGVGESGVVTAPKILTGSYDGIVRIYNASGKVETQLTGHSQPVKAVKFISPNKFVTAGMDRSIRLWRSGIVSDEDVEKDTQNGSTYALLDYHKSTVSSLALNLPTNRILSGSYDNSVALWSTNPKEMTTSDPIDMSDKISSASRKRMKLAIKDSTIRRKAPLAILESHHAPVEDVIFDHNDSSIAYSVSQDHTIKTWDLMTGRCVDTKQTNYSLLSLVSLNHMNLLATGSSARHINLHDPRSSKVTNSQLIGHTNFVVSLATTDNDYMLISGSHDGTAKVWDIRANKAMYTITRQSQEPKSKVFSVNWEKEIGIMSTGSDKKLQINSSAEFK